MNKVQSHSFNDFGDGLSSSNFRVLIRAVLIMRRVIISNSHRCGCSELPGLASLLFHEKSGRPSPVCGAYPRAPFTPSLWAIKHGNRLYILPS